jgi:tetratricopeptide (TPR) repeat protein
VLLAGWLLCGVALGQSLRDAEKCAEASGLDEMIAACSRAIESGDLAAFSLSIIFYNRGTAWGYKGDYDRAIADFNEAIRLRPEYALAYNNRGNAWNYKGDHDRAIADYSEVIRFNPKYALAYNNRGAAWNYKGDHDRAIADYSEAIRLNPEYALAYNNRGAAWNYKGDHGRAIADYSEAIRVNPKDARAYLNRGVTRFALGRFELANADFFEALRVNPSDAYVVLWRYFAQSRAGHATAAASELVANAAQVDKAKSPEPIIDLLAGLTDVAGVLKAATNSDQKAQHTQMCRAAFFVGQWYLLQGRRSEARASLERAERDCPKNLFESFSASAELKRLSQ